MEERPGMPVSYPSPEARGDLRTLTHILYGLFAVHWFTGGLSIVVAVIIAYLKRDDASLMTHRPPRSSLFPYSSFLRSHR